MGTYSNVAHAIAYVDVFMRANGIDEHPELGLIYSHVDTLSSDEVVSIIKDSVRQSDLFGKELILREMDSLDFRFYVQKKLNQIRYRQSMYHGDSPPNAQIIGA